MTQIKICGITRAVDLELALELEVDAVGFNFVPGTPRALALESACELGRIAARRTLVVGVFRNAPLPWMLECAKRVGLDCIQLHGEEPDHVVRGIALPVIQALKADAAGLTRARALAEVDVLLDHPAGGGGTGRSWDFGCARSLSRDGRRVWIAGGLGPDNVAAAIEAAAPYGVDACSALESRPGVKDPGGVRAFVNAARAAAARLSERS